MTLSLLFTKSITVFVEWLSRDKSCLLMKQRAGIQRKIMFTDEAKGRKSQNTVGLLKERQESSRSRGARLLRTRKALNQQPLSTAKTWPCKSRHYSSHIWVEGLNESTLIKKLHQKLGGKQHYMCYKNEFLLILSCIMA